MYLHQFRDVILAHQHLVDFSVEVLDIFAKCISEHFMHFDSISD